MYKENLKNLKHKDMKTAIKTLFATALTAIVLTSSAFTTFAKEGDKNPSEISAVSGFNMIKVKGNVTVYLRQGTKESFRVETDQPEAKVSFKRDGNKLFIDAADDQATTVYLTVKDLKRIDASENAVVKSTGCFKLPVLQVFVQDNAKVEVNVVAQDVYTVIKDASSLKLSGSTDRHISVKGEASNLNVTRFAALKTTSSTPLFAAAADLDAQLAEATNLAVMSSKNSK
ncbi:hypothetical protein DBR11_14090 [Pedobacter sp. HMWF019]|nr:hypothetical protein DBR11_14090 [Pedobacter sp. HMWF019]